MFNIFYTLYRSIYMNDINIISLDTLIMHINETLTVEDMEL